jgi:transposase
LDESSISTALNHNYGRAPRGEQVVLHAPTYGARRTLLGAIGLDGRKALSVLHGGMKVADYQAFIADHLVPMLKPGDVVVMDNLRIHKRAEAIAAIEATGAKVVFQPCYSPEFNAIEHCWAWIKQALRHVAVRAVDVLVDQAKKRWEAIDAGLCRSWARGCGYAV